MYNIYFIINKCTLKGDRKKTFASLEAVHTKRLQIIWCLVSNFYGIGSVEYSASQKILLEQECIPVGCIPSAAVAVGGGGVWPGGCVCPGDVCPGRCLTGGSVWPGGCLPQCMLGYTPPHCEQNHRSLWKHNLAATMLRTVKSNTWEAADNPRYFNRLYLLAVYWQESPYRQDSGFRWIFSVFKNCIPHRYFSEVRFDIFPKRCHYG